MGKIGEEMKRVSKVARLMVVVIMSQYILLSLVNEYNSIVISIRCKFHIKHAKISWTRFGSESDTGSVVSMDLDLGTKYIRSGSRSGSCLRKWIWVYLDPVQIRPVPSLAMTISNNILLLVFPCSKSKT